MTPTIGRVVHLREVTFENPNCLAAMVTAVENSKGKEAQFWATAFPPGHAPRPVVVVDMRTWHDPKECPNDSNGK